MSFYEKVLKLVNDLYFDEPENDLLEFICLLNANKYNDEIARKVNSYLVESVRVKED